MELRKKLAIAVEEMEATNKLMELSLDDRWREKSWGNLESCYFLDPSLRFWWCSTHDLRHHCLVILCTADTGMGKQRKSSWSSTGSWSRQRDEPNVSRGRCRTQKITLGSKTVRFVPCWHQHSGLMMWRCSFSSFRASRDKFKLWFVL
jgi:hypothetical protein